VAAENTELHDELAQAIRESGDEFSSLSEWVNAAADAVLVLVEQRIADTRNEAYHEGFDQGLVDARKLFAAKIEARIRDLNTIVVGVLDDCEIHGQVTALEDLLRVVRGDE